MNKNKIIIGNGNRELGFGVCELLKMEPIDTTITKFAVGETFCKINEDIRHSNIYIIQSLQPPINDNLMEILVLADACKRASASSINLVIPHFAYARQDRKCEPRTPITASLVSKLLEVAGVNSIITLDIHSTQSQGFFNGPHDDIPGVAIALPQIKHLIGHVLKESMDKLSIISPDAGGVKRARAFSNKLGASFAMVNKVRSLDGKATAMEVIGNVKSKVCIIVDDMIDTGGTVVEAVNILKENGANKIYALMTHGILSDPALDRIKNCENLELLYISNTMNHFKDKINKNSKIELIKADRVIAQTIMAHMQGKSIASLFK